MHAMEETRKTWVQSLDWKESLEKEMTTDSSILVWEIPWREGLVGYSSIGFLTVGHD